MMKNFVAAVPYSHAPIDFAALLSSARGVEVSRKGPQRRVHIRLDESRVEELKVLLPSHVVIEPATGFNTQRIPIARQLPGT
jgi:hypothetical protein